MKEKLSILLLKKLVLLPNQEIRLEINNDVSKNAIDTAAKEMFNFNEFKYDQKLVNDNYYVQNSGDISAFSVSSPKKISLSIDPATKDVVYIKSYSVSNADFDTLYVVYTLKLGQNNNYYLYSAMWSK